MIETQKPILHIIYINEFGDKTEIIKDLIEPTCSEVVASFREALLGMGFHPNNVQELIPETVYDFS